MAPMPLYIGSCQPDYTRFATAEIRSLDPAAGEIKPLSAGVCLFEAPAEFPRRAAERPPVFLRHLHPVGAEVTTTDDGPADIALLAAAAWDLLATAGWPAGTAVAVQVRRVGAGAGATRFAIKEALDPVLLQQGAVPVTRGAAAVVSVTLVGKRAYLGLSTPADNLSPWPGGEVHYQRDGAVSRAGHKLEEALEVFGLVLRSGWQALDLGAAPGGWTQVLLQHGLQVIAVDPAELDPSLRGQPGLTYRQQNARDVAVAENSLDLLTCDMNWDPYPTARLVADKAAAGLRPGGQGLLTVKLPQGRPTRTYKEVGHILAGRGLQVERVKQLYHNRDEVTLWFSRPALPPANPPANPSGKADT